MIVAIQKFAWQISGLVVLLVIVAFCFRLWDTEEKAFKYLGHKTELATRGLSVMEHRMELYALNGDFDVNAFRELCLRRALTASASEGITYLVLFDDASNAAFPKDTFTSEYGTEGEKRKHIKAYYEYNPWNMSSGMTIFSPNMYDHEGRRESVHY